MVVGMVGGGYVYGGGCMHVWWWLYGGDGKHDNCDFVMGTRLIMIIDGCQDCDTVRDRPITSAEGVRHGVQMLALAVTPQPHLRNHASECVGLCVGLCV